MRPRNVIFPRTPDRPDPVSHHHGASLMMSKTFFRYAAVLSLFACAACAPQDVPIGDEIKADVASQVAPVAADAAQAAVASVKPAH
jgi:hypothetical protein